MRAYKQVLKNKGSCGVDGLNVKDLYAYLHTHRKEIEASLREGRYFPQSILGVRIPKSNGKTRLLGIPTVVDRWLQQAVSQTIGVRFEPHFEQFSYGFRPHKNAQQAVLQAQEYINCGYQHIVDMDLKNFFDEVDHCVLLQLLYREIKCKPTLRLIRKWLKAPISIDGKLVKRNKGVPQGSPLSPLLSNILLDELDKEFQRKGYGLPLCYYCYFGHQLNRPRKGISTAGSSYFQHDHYSFSLGAGNICGKEKIRHSYYYLPEY